MKAAQILGFGYQNRWAVSVTGDLQPSRVAGLNSSCTIPKFSGQGTRAGFHLLPTQPSSTAGVEPVPGLVGT